MTKKERINLAADIVADLIKELIRMAELRTVEKRLTKQIKELQSQNLELTSRLAVLEREAEMPKTAKSSGIARAKFRIHGMDNDHVGQANLGDEDFCEDAKQLNAMIKHSADLIERQFKNPSIIKVISDKTGAAYEVTYKRDIFPTANVTITHSGGMRISMPNATISNAAKYILDHDGQLPTGYYYGTEKR